MNIGINRESNARLLDSRLFNRNRIQYDCDVTSDGFSSLVYRGDVSRVPSYLPHSRYFPFLREELNQIFSTHRPMDCVGEDVLAKADLFFPIGQILSDSEARRCIRPSGTVNRRIRETSRDYSWFPFFFFFFFYIDAVVHTGLCVGQRVYLRADAYTFLRGSVVRHHGE